jgi:hypothetical protein
LSGFVSLEDAEHDLGITATDVQRRASRLGLHLLVVAGAGGGARIRRRDVEDIRAELADLAARSRLSGLPPEKLEPDFS